MVYDGKSEKMGRIRIFLKMIEQWWFTNSTSSTDLKMMGLKNMIETAKWVLGTKKDPKRDGIYGCFFPQSYGKKRGGNPRSSIFFGFSILNHPARGVPVTPGNLLFHPERWWNKTRHFRGICLVIKPSWGCHGDRTNNMKDPPANPCFNRYGKPIFPSTTI